MMRLEESALARLQSSRTTRRLDPFDNISFDVSFRQSGRVDWSVPERGDVMIRGIESNRLEGRRVIAAMLALLMFGVGVGQSGCFGSFKLTRKLYEVNKEASGNKFVRWLVFLGLTILPAYAGAMFVDVFIMNVIEFWSKGDPQVEVTAGDGPEHETIALEGGGTLHMERIEGGVRTRIVRGGGDDLRVGLPHRSGAARGARRRGRHARMGSGRWRGGRRRHRRGTANLRVVSRPRPSLRDHTGVS